MNARIEWRGDLAKTQAKQGAVAGLRAAAEAVLAASNAAAPTETGHLVDSSGTDVDTDALVASVYYDPQMPPNRGGKVYAIVRHEAMRQGGSPKYLERPLLQNRATVLQLIAGQIRSVL
ncbi:MAG TPA: hypothetical protein VK095_10895 [Beutenbergiaceae bacterium]|nr:hypothetical protein [Beutenbergiaceae bacterium]